MKIAIRFGDNDFGNTFLGVMRVLYDSFKHIEGTRHPLTTNKEKLCFLINNLSPIIYITHQNMYEHNGLEQATGLDTATNEEFVHMKNYLQGKVTPERVLVNEEVDAYIQGLGKDKWANSETIILDTDLHSNNIYFL